MHPNSQVQLRIDITNGVYRLENLPAGDFVLKAWVDEKTVWQQPVAIKAAQTTRVEFPVK